MAHTKEEIVHRIDDNLVDEIKVRQPRKLRVARRMVLHERLASGRGYQFAVLFTETTMLFIRPRGEGCNVSAWSALMTATHLLV